MNRILRLTRPPARLRRVELDNLALVPGDLLLQKQEWQTIANRLPPQAILIVLPQDHLVQKQTMLTVARLLAADGHQVRVVPALEIKRCSPDTKQPPR